jgi:hypothetical protein
MRDGHVDPRRGGGAKPPEGRGAAVAQHAVAGQRGREPAAVEVHDRVTDRVDAAVEPMQPPCGQPSLDPTAIEPELDQLPPAHDAVLSPGERGKPDVWGRLYTHTVY